MNVRVMKTIVKHIKELKSGMWIDAYNMSVKDKICGTITIGISFRNENWVVVNELVNIKNEEIHSK